MDRRRALKVLGAAPFLGVAALDAQQPAPSQSHPAAGHPPEPKPQPAKNAAKNRFFTAKEARLAAVLADDIIPRDAKSGSATESGVIQFIDFHMSVPETDDNARVQMRGGLRWIDTESKRRFGVGYAAAKPAQRHEILDDLAWPQKAKPEFSTGVSFFLRFRDMTAAGFFSSAIGFKDLQYQGNTFNPGWNGCPEPAMQKLGVSHALMDTRVPSQVKVSER